MAQSIKILIADDHEIVLDGLKSILNTTHIQDAAAVERAPFQIIGVAESGEGVLVRLEQLPTVDVVVLDYYMGEMNGLETALVIQQRFPRVKVVLFSMEESDIIITEAFTHNVDAYVTKGEGRQRLVEAIKRVHKGERVFPMLKHAASGKIPWRPVQTAGRAPTVLSKRETEVACQIIQGLTTQEIADVLGIAFNTVEVHRTNIYRKLEINKVAELVKYGLEMGLCE